MAASKHNGHGHVTETPDVSHIKNLDVTHEASDVSISGILKFVVGLTIFGVAVYILMWGMFRFLNAHEREKEPKPGPMAMTEQERRPPDPKLQSAPGFGVKLADGQWVPLENREPQAEYRVLREQWDRTLAEGSRDQNGKLLGMPIDQAMQKVLEGKGLPARVQEGRQESGIEMPTAASSGRMTEKKKQ